MHAVLFLALLQPAPPAEPLRSGCSIEDQQIGSVEAGDRVEVRSALAGGGPTCYRVNVIRSGQKLSGYVLGESLPSIRDFVRLRERISEASAKEEARRTSAAALEKKHEAGTTGSADPLISTQFADFAGRDTSGKTVSLAGLKGRVTVVTFWSPDSPRSMSDLEHAMPLYNQFHKSGMAAVGVSMNPHADILEALDDVTIPWPQMPDQSGLAARYHVDPRAGKTFVLDADHRIVAAGPMGPEIEKAVREQLGVPAQQ
jgi:peroxiredoxin